MELNERIETKRKALVSTILGSKLPTDVEDFLWGMHYALSAVWLGPKDYQVSESVLPSLMETLHADSKRRRFTVRQYRGILHGISLIREWEEAS